VHSIRQIERLNWQIRQLYDLYLARVSVKRYDIVFKNGSELPACRGCSLNWMGGGGNGTTGSAALFGTLRIPIASAEALCCSLFGLDAIGRVVVEQVGVEGWTLSFCVSSFLGGFGRAVVCFICTHAELEPLVFSRDFRSIVK
jgi:hypothetical protein